MADEFEEITARAGRPMGEQEIQARAAIGDERYDTVIAHNDAVADAHLRQTTALTLSIDALSSLRYAGALAIVGVTFAAMCVAVAFLVSVIR